MALSSATGVTQVIRLRNTTDREQELWIEPLGDRVEMASNALYELTATNALEEINLSAEGFIVYGWITRVTAIADDGSENVVWELPD